MTRKYPKYEPDSQARRCYNGRTQSVSKGTQYVYINGHLSYVCGSCATKMAQDAGIEPVKESAKARRAKGYG